jgi:hypothetical protein
MNKELKLLAEEQSEHGHGSKATAKRPPPSSNSQKETHWKQFMVNAKVEMLQSKEIEVVHQLTCSSIPSDVR